MRGPKSFTKGLILKYVSFDDVLLQVCVFCQKQRLRYSAVSVSFFALFVTPVSQIIYLATLPFRETELNFS